MNRVRTLALAALVSACGSGEPLQVETLGATLVSPNAVGLGPFLSVELRLENHGDAPVHVFTDLLQVVGENGTHGSVREFRDRYRLALARAASPDERTRIEAALQPFGIDRAAVRELVQSQIEVPAGQSLTRVMPFLLRGAPKEHRYRLNFAYHDDGSDRLFKTSLPIKSR